MAGEKARKLLYELREELQDHDKKLVPVDVSLYNRLTHYESEIFEQGKFLREKEEVSLLNGTKEYTIPEKFLEVTSFDFNDDIAVFPVVEFDKVTTPTKKMYLTNSDTFKSGDKIILYGFVKPVSSHKINKDTDPLLPDAFFYLLKKLVLSEYRHIRKDFEDEDSIMVKVKKKAKEFRGINKANPGNPFNNLSF